jgi:hypothetical protein
MCDRLDDIGRDKDFETQQQRAPDADLVDVGVLLGNGLPQLAILLTGDAVTMMMTPKISIPLPTTRIE